MELKIIRVESVIDYQLMYQAAQEEVGRIGGLLKMVNTQNQVLQQRLVPHCRTCVTLVLVVEPLDEVLDDKEFILHRGHVVALPPVKDEFDAEI